MTHLYLMSHVFTIFLALCVFSPTCPVDADLSDVLSNYDVLHQSQISHIIVKRGTKGKGDHVKELKFSGLGRHFTLSLKPTVGLLSPQFKAYVVDGYGNKEAVPVDPEIFFSGVVTGEKTSSVQAYVDDDNLLTATIATPDDTYHIEPMWQYAPEGGNDSMVMYKGSDVKRIQKHHSHDSFCGYVTPPPGVIVDNKIDDEEHKKSKKGKNQGFSKENDIADKHSRVKRQQQSSHSDGRTRCSLFLVADYKFFSEMGQGNRLNTINYLIGLIHVVNEIYLSTTWEKNITNMAFVVRDVLVHKEAQKNLAVGDEHYNMDKSGWDVKNLLTAFSRGNYRSYCLAHLFTHQKFAGGVLGLAYVGSPRQHTVGGICTPEYYSDGVLWLNTGLSSSLNYANRKVVKKEANIVTAHELGHNWGSEHDPDTDECANPDGGSYIMYTYSVSGYYNNNDNFSPCSKRSVGMVLQAKASKCFTEPTTAFCGNFLVEEGEECDAGLIESGEEDPCCTHNCELKSECSDKNSPCCDGCSFANKGFECRKASQLDALCEKDAECTGTSAECPKGSPVENVKNVSCLDSGTCIDGICVPYCEVREMFSCVCDGGDGCKRCCRSATRNCTKYTNQDNPFGIQLDEGQPCHLGICSDEGICEKTQQDAVQRFWNIIEDIDINYILEFIHDNIVGTVIILSLIVWIPASCIVNYVDNKRREKEEEEMTWRRPDVSFIHKACVNYDTPSHIPMAQINEESEKDMAAFRINNCSLATDIAVSSLTSHANYQKDRDEVSSPNKVNNPDLLSDSMFRGDDSAAMAGHDGSGGPAELSTDSGKSAPCDTCTEGEIKNDAAKDNNNNLVYSCIADDAGAVKVLDNGCSNMIEATAIERDNRGRSIEGDGRRKVSSKPNYFNFDFQYSDRIQGQVYYP